MRKLRGSRYIVPAKEAELKALGRFLVEELPYLDFPGTMRWYKRVVPLLDDNGLALLGCNDRYFLLTGLLHRRDALHPWLFDRFREIEEDPDGHIDLWARGHYKSSAISFSGTIQEIICDPEIKIAIFSVVKPIAQEFLAQIKDEFENNEDLKRVYKDVLYTNPKSKGEDGRPSKWGVARGITVKRVQNPKEATVEAHGLIDGQPTSRHFDLHIYDDVVTQDYIQPDQIKKTTQRWEMADNLGTHLGVRKQMAGTFYHFADTYTVIIERKSLKPRIYPATDDGTMTGNPVFLTPERWKHIKNEQRSTVSAQMLLNPVSGTDATFKPHWLKTYLIVPNVMNVYIMCDPSKGMSNRSDRTAIAVIGVDHAGNKYLLDGVCHRMKLSDRYALLTRYYDKWRQHSGVQFVKVGYERYGMQVDLEVIQDYQERDKKYFEIEELNTPKQGRHAKPDRIERLEPDMRAGTFYLPGVVYHPDYGDRSGLCYWQVWSEEDTQAAIKHGRKIEYTAGQVVYRPMRGQTKLQQWYQANEGSSRIVTALKRRNEDNDIYDLTRSFIAEYLQHPFAPHDDMLDASSRIYDMEVMPPEKYEAGMADGQTEDDLGFERGAGDDGGETVRYDA
jgi:hypothetical protein